MMMKRGTSSAGSGQACRSPGLNGRHHAPPAFESGCRSDDREAYVLPPLRIDTSPISLQLPLWFFPVQHELYEAKAPPPVSFPYRLDLAQGIEAGACEQKSKQDKDETISVAASINPLTLFSLSTQLFSRETRQTPLQDDTSMSSCPCPFLSRSPFREASPKSPSLITSAKPVVPRCSPPRSNAHASFPSPPPTPPGEAETAPFFGNIGAPAPRRAHLPTRRYLAPVFVRGEVLPFAIVEEEEQEQDQAKPNAVVQSSPDDELGKVNGRAEPETSGSEYSMESAPVVESGGEITSTDSSIPGNKSVESAITAPSSIHRAGSKKAAKRWRQEGALAMEMYAKRAAGGMSKLSEHMKEFVGINRRLRIRGRT